MGTTAVMARLCAGLVLVLSTLTTRWSLWFSCGCLVLSTLTTATPPTPRSPLAEATDSTRCGGKEAVNETLSELMEDYFKWKLHTYPEWATMEGFPGYNHLVEDFSMVNPRKGREVPRIP